ncbi:MAG: class I SAM-dependent methyltransferase [Phycisphaerales bacterium]
MTTSTTLSPAKPASLAAESLPGWEILAIDREVVMLRRQGASTPVQPDWQDRLRTHLATIHGLSIVGCKRLTADGNSMASAGEFVIHPKGLHSLGCGIAAEAFSFPHEVDAIMGGIIAVERSVYERAMVRARQFNTLAALALAVDVRLQGKRIVMCPDVTCIDPIDCCAAVPDDVHEREREQFMQVFGFDHRAVDLDAIRASEKLAPLRWNVRYFGGDVRYTKYQTRPLLHWQSYRDVPVYRSRADAIVSFLAEQVNANDGASRSYLDIGCGDGLFSALLSRNGMEVTGIDIEEDAIAQAQEATASEKGSLQFVHAQPGRLPFEDASFGAVGMLDVIEHLSNPVGLLREIERVLQPGGLVCIATPAWQYGSWSDAVFHVTEYTEAELLRQLQATRFTPLRSARIGAPYRDVIAIARKSATVPPTAATPA